MKKTSPCTYRAHILVEKADNGHMLRVEEWLLFTELRRIAGGAALGRKIRSFILDMLSFRCQLDV